MLIVLVDFIYFLFIPKIIDYFTLYNPYFMIYFSIRITFLNATERLIDN